MIHSVLNRVLMFLIWELGLAISSRLLLGSTLVGSLSAALFGGIYWWLLKRSQQGRAHT